LQGLDEEEDVEKMPVLLSDAIVEEETVMIEG
jgi:hypothetical protein